MLNNNFHRSSGITLSITRLISSPPFKGVDVYLAGCEMINGEHSQHEDTSMVPIRRYRSFPLMGGFPSIIPALLAFGRWVHEMGIDIIHAHHRRLAVLANLLRPFTKVPILFTGHLTFPEAGWFRYLIPRNATGVSPSVVHYLHRCTNASNIHMIHNPVEFPGLVARSYNLLPCRVVSLGRLDPVKGHSNLIRAWSVLKSQGINAQLDIFGEGSLRAVLQAEIDRLNLHDCVRLCGFSSDLSRRLPGYAFNVLVSQKEGFPNSVVEAAAQGLPTLLTAVDGSRDTLPPNLTLPNGLPYGDAEALSNALRTWLGSPQSLIVDGKYFHDYLEPRCSPLAVGDSYIKLYESLSSGRNISRT